MSLPPHKQTAILLLLRLLPQHTWCDTSGDIPLPLHNCHQHLHKDLSLHTTTQTITTTHIMIMTMQLSTVRAREKEKERERELYPLRSEDRYSPRGPSAVSGSRSVYSDRRPSKLCLHPTQPIAFHSINTDRQMRLIQTYRNTNKQTAILLLLRLHWLNARFWCMSNHCYKW